MIFVTAYQQALCQAWRQSQDFNLLSPMASVTELWQPGWPLCWPLTWQAEQIFLNGHQPGWTESWRTFKSHQQIIWHHANSLSTELIFLYIVLQITIRGYCYHQVRHGILSRLFSYKPTIRHFLRHAILPRLYYIVGLYLQKLSLCDYF